MFTIKLSVCRCCMRLCFSFMVCKTRDSQKCRNEQIFGCKQESYQRYQSYLLKKKIVIFCTYFITKTISDLFSQQWFDFSYFPHFWEPDSIFQKLERFGRNLLMSLELLRVCPDFTPHSSSHLCWIYLAFEKCCKLVIIGAEEVNRNPLKFKMILLPKKLSWVWCCHMHPRL